MQARLWIDLAEQILSGDEQNEAAWRSAAHAAYYSVYHISVQYFGFRPTGSGARHADIHDLLTALPIKSNTPRHIRMARTVYGELKTLRVRADYHIDVTFTSDDGDRALQLAQMVASALPR